MPYIYKITNLINNKVYIGKTNLLSIEERWAEHCKDYQKIKNEKRPLYEAMRKYGIDNFIIELIETVPNDEAACQQEQYWIQFFNSYIGFENSNGYNATLGGDGKVLYDYNRFIQEYLSGKLVQEIAELYHCSTDTVTQALHQAGISGKINANARQSNKIAQYSKEGVFIQNFSSQREAARWLIANGSKGKLTSITTNIGRVIKGERKTAEGYIWKQIE